MGREPGQLGRKAREEYAKGWIECFHAYQSLGPADTHWTLEHFEKYSEDDFVKDVFEDGYVDVAIFQPTYLTEWYKNRLQYDRNATANSGFEASRESSCINTPVGSA